MSIKQVTSYLAAFGLADRVREFDVSSATVELAAKALNTDGARIAKTISLHNGQGGCLLIVCAGDQKIDNAKFKARFGTKAKMLSADEALAMTGHAVGGVCPFALPEGVSVFTDISLQRFETVYPAAGSANSAVALSCDELFAAANANEWVDVCRPKEQPIEN